MDRSPSPGLLFLIECNTIEDETRFPCILSDSYERLILLFTSLKLFFLAIRCSVNMNIPSGSLVAVVGHVGCGKTTLLSALLGETEKLSGKVYVKVCLIFFFYFSCLFILVTIDFMF